MNPFAMTCGHCAPGQLVPGRSVYAPALRARVGVRGVELGVQRALHRAFGQGEDDEEDELLQLINGGGPPEGNLGNVPIYRTVETPVGVVLVINDGYEPTVQGYLKAYDVVQIAGPADSAWLTLVRRQDAGGNAPSYLPGNGAQGVIVDTDPTVSPPQLKMAITRNLTEGVAGKSAFMPTGQPIIIGQPVGGWAETGKKVGAEPAGLPFPNIDETVETISKAAAGFRVGAAVGGVLAIGGLVLYSRRRRR